MAKKKKEKKENRKVIPDYAFHQKSMVWCIRNGYRIYPERNDRMEWNIAVELGLKKAVFPEPYKQSEIQYGLYQAFKTIYLKHNKD